MKTTYDKVQLISYLEKIARNPTSIPFPDSDYILDEVQQTSHAGSYLKGFVDGNISGERVLIGIIIDYLESH